MQRFQSENAFHEAYWQEKIIHLIQLIFPKYIAVLSNVHIKEWYSKIDEKNHAILTCF